MAIFHNIAFCDEENIVVDREKTIKELKENINVLSKDKKDLNLKFFSLNKNSILKSFFKEKLTSTDVNSIKSIINWYILHKDELEKSIVEKSKILEDSTEEKKSLFDKKEEFYKNLVPFIKKDKLKEYLEYITSDVEILKEKKDVDTKIIMKKEIINDKLEKIENKIIKNKESLDMKFKKILSKKIDNKIEELKNSKKFKNLELNLQKIALSKVIEKVKIKIDVLESKINKTSTLLRKLETYKILLSKLNDYLNVLEKEEN